ncbi:MAG: hypothetical protein ACOYLB_05990 [Phototrophicaceae bacterium]
MAARSWIYYLVGGFLLYAALTSIIRSFELLPLLAAVGGGGLLLYQLNRSWNGDAPHSVEWHARPSIPNRQHSPTGIHPHALTALQQAGHQAGDLAVLPLDLGIIATCDNQSPTVYRSSAIPNDVDYIRPYVEFHIPSTASGTVTFEIYNTHGDLMYQHHQLQAFHAGKNLVVSNTHLPVHDALHLEEGAWWLRIKGDNIILADHRITWVDSPSRLVQEHIAEDGEISAELRTALAENKLGTMSLDELLSFQDDDPPPAQNRRSF